MKNKIPPLICALLLSSCQKTLTNPYINQIRIPSFSFNRPSVYSFIDISSPQSTSSSSKASSSTILSDYFYSERYGPLPLGSEDFDATFTFQLFSIASQNIIERIRILNPSNNNVLSASSHPSRSYTQGLRDDVTFTIPLHDYWTNDGLTLKFEILNAQSRQIIKDYSSTFYPPSNSVISFSDLKKERYVSRSLGFYGNGETLCEYKETFDFTEFGDYLNIDYYFLLDLRKNKFKYLNDIDLSFSSITLRFIDDDFLFPYINHDSNGYINLPLILKRNNTEVIFKYAHPFYLNKRTLQISNSYHQGFSLTDNFYLPINGKDIFNNKIIYINVSGLGKDNISTSIILRYDVDKNYVGLCSNGDYCIVGGNR